MWEVRLVKQVCRKGNLLGFMAPQLLVAGATGFDRWGLVLGRSCLHRKKGPGGFHCSYFTWADKADSAA